MSSEFDHEYDEYNVVKIDWEEPKPKLRFQRIAADEFASSFTSEWFIKDILPKSELIVLYGGVGSGKSFMALDMALSLIRGLEWNGKRTRKSKVVYLVAEGAGNFKKRLIAYTLHHKLNLSDLKDITFIADCPNFMKNDDTPLIINSLLTDTIPDLIIIDTFAQTALGGNENSSEDMGHALAQCRAIHASTKATIMLIHHAGKNVEQGARGWSGLKAAADAEIEVTKIGGGHRAKITKQKDGDDNLEWGFSIKQLVIGTDDYMDEVTSCVYLPSNSIPIQPSRERRLGKNESIIMESFKRFESPYVPVEDLLTEAIKYIAYEESKRDKRKENALRALNGMREKGYFEIINNSVSLA